MTRIRALASLIPITTAPELAFAIGAAKAHAVIALICHMNVRPAPLAFELTLNRRLQRPNMSHDPILRESVRMNTVAEQRRLTMDTRRTDMDSIAQEASEEFTRPRGLPFAINEPLVLD